jgi:hypothetical protein
MKLDIYTDGSHIKSGTDIGYGGWFIHNDTEYR